MLISELNILNNFVLINWLINITKFSTKSELPDLV